MPNIDGIARSKTVGDEFMAKIGVRPLVMGILNVTPDSFSDGSKFVSAPSALVHAKMMKEQGADIIDIGAESTRPGFQRVDEREEWERLEPVLEPLIKGSGVPVSVDTSKAAIARRAIALGAAVINDVTGLRGDPGMGEAVAESGAALIVMHNRATVDPALDIVADMIEFFEFSLALARKAGISRNNIILDPGIGFGKSVQQNLLALTAIGALDEKFGLPLAVGLSRKSFLGVLTGAPTEDRLAPTLAANLYSLARGAKIFRVHDVAEHVTAFKIWSELVHD
jgi:dihydropteroate synthase